MRHGLRTIAVLVATAGLTMTACGDGDHEATTGIANPASVYCEERGGHVDIEETDAGQRGMCALPDGTRVDEWDLYRARTTTTTEATATCSATGLPLDVADESNLPPAVAAMRAELVRAAATCDYVALARLADRNGAAVRFSWGDEADPVAFWRRAEEGGDDPRPLRALRLLLGLAPAETDAGGDHVQYVWPAAFASEHPTEAQLEEVAATGLYDLAVLRRWVVEGTNYLGYRVMITADGDWTAFVAGD